MIRHFDETCSDDVRAVRSCCDIILDSGCNCDTNCDTNWNDFREPSCRSISKWKRLYIRRMWIFRHMMTYVDIGVFLKWWYPTTMGFPTKNDHFGVFWGTTIFGNTPVSDKSLQAKDLCAACIVDCDGLPGLVAARHPVGLPPDVRRKVNHNDEGWLFLLGINVHLSSHLTHVA